MIGNLERAYNGDGKVRPRQAFNEFVAHMTKSREEHAKGYNYDREFYAIDPQLKAIIEQIKRLFVADTV